jgi:hypothetical protein
MTAKETTSLNEWRSSSRGHCNALQRIQATHDVVVVQVQALVPAQVEEEVGAGAVVEAVEQGSALECSWEEREAVPVSELVLVC